MLQVPRSRRSFLKTSALAGLAIGLEPWRLISRAPFADGLYAEAGAMFAGGPRVTRYAALFGIGLEAEPRGGAAFVYHLRGRRLRVGAGPVEWPLELKPEEAAGGWREAYIAPLLDEVGDPLADGWPPERLRKYDQLSPSCWPSVAPPAASSSCFGPTS